MEFDRLFSPDRPQPTCKEVVCAVAKDTIANAPFVLLNSVRSRPLTSLSTAAIITGEAVAIGSSPDIKQLLNASVVTYILGISAITVSYYAENAYRSDCVQSALIAFRHYRKGDLGDLTMQDIRDELHPEPPYDDRNLR